jgi:hypothetical protein
MTAVRDRDYPEFILTALVSFKGGSAMVVYSVLGVYAAISEAEAAVRSLGDGGFPIQKVSIVAKHLEDIRRVHGYVTACDVARSAAATGAWVGGIFGLLVGADFLGLPGVAPLAVAGSLAALLLGGVEGAVAGATTCGLLGWLMGLVIARKKVLKYEEALQSGRFLVIAHGTAADVKKAGEILASSAGDHLEFHAPAA